MFLPSSNVADAVGIINLHWVAHLKQAHKIFLNLGKFRLLCMPSHNVPKRYSPLMAQWAAKINWSNLGWPMSYRQALQVWLLAQCKIQDLLGMVNFFDSHYLHSMPRSLNNAPWVFNFIGVTHKSLPDGPTHQVHIRDGVPMLETKKKRKADRRWIWKDVCHTDNYVLEEHRQLKKEGKAPGTQVNQCISSTVRKSMCAGMQEFAKQPLLPDMLDKQCQATWKDMPALYPGREIQPLPQALGGATLIAYMPIQPLPLSKAFPKHNPSWGPTPWALIAEPYCTVLYAKYKKNTEASKDSSIRTGLSSSSSSSTSTRRTSPGIASLSFASPSPAPTHPAPSPFPAPTSPSPSPFPAPTSPNPSCSSPSPACNHSPSPASPTPTALSTASIIFGVIPPTPTLGSVAPSMADPPAKKLSLKEWTVEQCQHNRLAKERKLEECKC
ncbi:hypothetical protein CALCODRAFT_479829 [Calocera cornea HHB12733]|uniref:Uncharacterized protein n=1 Tax=Calocera cornea HHB12733 TaxID=1353952 RepID=A0A165J9Q7_9BASI|nr:hypothetical protein CALCODRAFT_479829 [Calocera cornea HHB12733]